MLWAWWTTNDSSQTTRWAYGSTSFTRSPLDSLTETLTSLGDDVPVPVEFYDGSEARTLRAMHIDLNGKRVVRARSSSEWRNRNGSAVRGAMATLSARRSSFGVLE